MRHDPTDGDRLSVELISQLASIAVGRVDLVLEGLLGPKLSTLVGRTSWNSLILNPGSTSTKISVYNGLRLLAQGELSAPERLDTDIQARVDQVHEWLQTNGLDWQELTGIAARGGLMRPVASGTYRICERMLNDLATSPVYHASNLGAAMARRIAAQAGTEMLLTTTDPVMVDEILPAQRLTGSARVMDDGTAVHYLNQRAVAKLTAAVMGADLDEVHLITCHLGGGASAIRHQGGRAVQVAQAFGTLPSANRSGRLPWIKALGMIARKEINLEEVRKAVTRQGGLSSLAGTDDFREFFLFSERCLSPEQLEKVQLITDFFANRVAGEILGLSAAQEKIDAIVLTGGLACDEGFCRRVAERIHLPAPVVRVPGALEQSALAEGLLRACAESGSLKDYVHTVEEVEAERQKTAHALTVPLLADPRVATNGTVPASLEDLIRMARETTAPTIALVGADNAEALLAVKQAAATDRKDPRERSMARFLLLGDWERVTNLAWELDLPIDGQDVVAVDTPDPVGFAVEILEAGWADTMMKGSVSTADVLKGFLRFCKSQGGIQHRLSHLALFDIPGRDKLLGLTDAAMNTNPDVEARIGILENSLDCLRLLGYQRPKVAVLSATEKPSKAVDSSLEARQIAERFTGRDDLIIDGPMALDLALSPESARDKGYQGAVKGDADLLLVPDIDVGNAVYKAFTVTSEADAAGAIIGGSVPLILTSRGDGARTKLAAMALAVVLIAHAKHRGAP